LSRSETSDIVVSIKNATGVTTRIANSILDIVLPAGQKAMHASTLSEKTVLKELSELIITGEFSEDDITDMRYQQSKYTTYWKAIEKFVELQGVGAHASRHATEQLEESVGGVGYTAVINSIKELMRRTNGYLSSQGTEEYDRPSEFFVGLQFSPLHPCRKSAERYTGLLNAKRQIQSRNVKTHHPHVLIT
jgi:hypothetical protein